MLPKARCIGKRDESRGVEKFMLCHYYGTIEGKKDEFKGVEKFMLCKYYCTIEGTFILDCSTLILKLRNIAHKLSWDHVMWVAVTSVTISFVFGTILKVISHKLSWFKVFFFCLFFFLIKWSFNVQIWMAGNHLGNVFLYSPAYPAV